MLYNYEEEFKQEDDVSDIYSQKDYEGDLYGDFTPMTRIDSTYSDVSTDNFPIINFERNYDYKKNKGEEFFVLFYVAFYFWMKEFNVAYNTLKAYFEYKNWDFNLTPEGKV